MSETTTGSILTPEGEQQIQTLQLDPHDAQLLREYKKFLQKYSLAEALYCKNCWNRTKNDGCEAHVTDDSILIRCRCAMRFYQGPTF